MPSPIFRLLALQPINRTCNCLCHKEERPNVREPVVRFLLYYHPAMFSQSRNLHHYCQSSLQNKKCLQTRQPNLTKRHNNFLAKIQLAKIQSDKARRQQLPTRIQQDPRQNLPTSIRHAKIHLRRPEPNKAKEHHPTRTPLPRDLSRRS